MHQGKKKKKKESMRNAAFIMLKQERDKHKVIQTHLSNITARCSIKKSLNMN